MQRVDTGNPTSAASPWRYDYTGASPLVYHGLAYLGIAVVAFLASADAGVGKAPRAATKGSSPHQRSRTARVRVKVCAELL